jgi:hypothetical protein
MDRTQVIAKIQSILKLQENTTFDGEASAAAAMVLPSVKQLKLKLLMKSFSLSSVLMLH